MIDATKTSVSFQSNLFNKTEQQDYFINPCCFGDDVCRFVINKLKSAGVACDDKPEQEDWGWYFYFWEGGISYMFGCSLGSDDQAPADTNPELCTDAWMGVIERHATDFLSRIGMGKKTVTTEAVQMIHQTLTNTEGISAISWHN